MTTEKTEWGPWIDHDLSGCPVDDGFILELEFKDDKGDDFAGVVHMGRDYEVVTWNILDKNCTFILEKWGRRIGILRYRVKKPKALQELLNIKVEKPNELLLC